MCVYVFRLIKDKPKYFTELFFLPDYTVKTLGSDGDSTSPSLKFHALLETLSVLLLFVYLFIYLLLFPFQ